MNQLPEDTAASIMAKLNLNEDQQDLFMTYIPRALRAARDFELPNDQEIFVASKTGMIGTILKTEEERAAFCLGANWLKNVAAS